MSGWRLPRLGRIDRSRPIDFRWAGRSLHGYAGDTLASALLANGVSILGRSFKYHRPRGLLASGLEEPNVIVQLESGAAALPNLKATQIELYPGLTARAVNAWPSASFDLLAVNSLLKRFIPAAFYYKTFTWPDWRWFQPMIRRAAGLGVAPAAADPDAYEHRFAHVDTLVIGSGAAGLAAAQVAAAGGGQVLLAELDPELGGGLLATGDPAVAAWRDAAIAALRAMPSVEILTRTMAFGFYDHGLIGLCERVSDHLPPAERRGIRQRLWKLRCGRVILAAGAFERPMAFAGNDLPGVMLASAAQAYALRYGAAAGRCAVVVTNNDSAYAAACALHDAGVRIAAIVDSRGEPGACAATVEARGIRLIAGALPLVARGRRGVRAVTLAAAGSGETLETIACDALLMSDGWNPAVHLHSQSGGSLGFDDALQAFLPDRAGQAVVSVGAAAGILDLDAAIESGRAAGAGAALPRPQSDPVGPSPSHGDGAAMADKAWLDFQNDVTVADVQLAARENFRSVEHVKRYTTLGMASDQGKTSNVSAIRALSTLLGRPASAIGTTKFRPPFDPVTLGAFAGRATGPELMPAARCAADAAQRALGGCMEVYGGWWRPAYYAQAGEDEHRAVRREVHAVREGVGLFDASPLGKIEVKGPDAAAFLQLMYATDLTGIGIGRCRYALMLDDNGIVFDDGIVARIADHHFLVGTTSSRAHAVAERFEEWLQCEWPQLGVLVENVTTAWSVATLAGPRAREVLAVLGTTIDLSPAAFPHMAYRAGEVRGVRARIERVSFSGELSYEIAVPWDFGAALWDACLEAGAPHGIAPFGIEALTAMRIEKGFLHVGTDTDGTTLPQDVGFGPAIARKSGDFVGRRSTERPDGLRTDRRQLVGLERVDGGPPLDVGAHVLPAGARDPRGTLGWVTSSVHSPTLGRPLAMALVGRGADRLGEPVRVWSFGEWREARIVDRRFYDPAGERVRG